jgi:chromosome segregation ATPase
MNTEQKQSYVANHIRSVEALQSRISELENDLEKERREGREEWERLQVSMIDELQKENASLKQQIEDLTEIKDGLIDDQQPLYDQYAAMMQKVDDLEKENQRLKEKEIRGDRMIVELEHEKAVLKAEIRAYKEYCERNVYEREGF